MPAVAGMTKNFENQKRLRRDSDNSLHGRCAGGLRLLGRRAPKIVHSTRVLVAAAWSHRGYRVVEILLPVVRQMANIEKVRMKCDDGASPKVLKKLGHKRA